MRLLTVSGSLREGSSNTALLDAVAALAGADVQVTAFRELADVPAFNPDLEGAAGPRHAAVAAWGDALSGADAVLISSPEYAHGVPGVLKNALDWVVGSGELVGKPVGVLNASSASQYAHPQLLETLRVMSAVLVPDACRIIDIPRRGVTVAGLIADPVIASMLRDACVALQAAVAARA
jgi:NAD(P)H-dependent FMN reductase